MGQVATVSVQEVIGALRRAGATVPDAYFLCTAQHESGFDAQAIASEPNGTRSLGLYQISEASGYPDLLTLDGNTRAMVEITERNRLEIREAAGLGIYDPDPWDMGAYLSVAHNQGLGAALETIEEYGMDWEAYAARNGEVVKPGFDGPRIVQRGWDCLYAAAPGASAGWSLMGGLLGVFVAAGIAVVLR